MILTLVFVLLVYFKVTLLYVAELLELGEKRIDGELGSYGARRSLTTRVTSISFTSSLSTPILHFFFFIFIAKKWVFNLQGLILCRNSIGIPLITDT